MPTDESYMGPFACALSNTVYRPILKVALKKKKNIICFLDKSHKNKNKNLILV